jgi:hypothetical protein
MPEMVAAARRAVLKAETATADASQQPLTASRTWRESRSTAPPRTARACSKARATPIAIGIKGSSIEPMAPPRPRARDGGDSAGVQPPRHRFLAASVRAAGDALAMLADPPGSVGLRPVLGFPPAAAQRRRLVGREAGNPERGSAWTAGRAYPRSRARPAAGARGANFAGLCTLTNATASCLGGLRTLYEFRWFGVTVSVQPCRRGRGNVPRGPALGGRTTLLRPPFADR